MSLTGTRKQETGNRCLIPQTNLQLFRQMLSLGYDESSVELANRAYLFAAHQTCRILRGSGKPFVCHLVGTAGILVEAGQDADCIGAALMHAMYQDRIPFPDDRDLKLRREYIRQHFGKSVESLVHDYHNFEVVRLDQFSLEQLRKRRTVVMMRLADELEDLLDHGVAMHGQPEDDETVGGSAASRRVQKMQLASEYQRAARAIGVSTIEQHLEYWLEQTASPQWPRSLRTGAYSSYEVSGHNEDRPA
ncbi:HD domain-containing protein [Wenzhouxiangella sp. EGI_FJ10305]|uniref:HD domain-containing protein n=1 Tax=Wenzhouxiangella sp. EGI_FJ10305 TaxID=3243768 RepID=UPI0035D61321